MQEPRGTCAGLQLILAENQRHPKLGREYQQPEGRRHDPDHQVWLTTDSYVPANNQRVSAEMLLPKLMTQHNNMIFSRCILARQECSPLDWRNAKNREEARAHAHGGDLFRRAVSCQRKFLVGLCRRDAL